MPSAPVLVAVAVVTCPSCDGRGEHCAGDPLVADIRTCTDCAGTGEVYEPELAHIAERDL